jgi:hypothetical protein
MMMLMNKPLAKRIALSCTLLLASAWLTVAVIRSKRTHNAEEQSLISSSELARHIQYLASDELAGRLAGPAGAEKAAAYIAREFEKQGLAPAMVVPPVCSRLHLWQELSSGPTIDSRWPAKALS